MPDELFTTWARLSLRQAYGVAAQALTVLHDRGLAQDTVGCACWDPASRPLGLDPVCTSDQVLHALDAFHGDAGTLAAQQRTGFPLMWLSAASQRWKLSLEWPGDTAFDADPETWDRAQVRLVILADETGGWLGHLHELGLRRPTGGDREWSEPPMIRLLHRGVAVRRMAEVTVGGTAVQPPSAGRPLAKHLLTTRPGTPLALLDELSSLGLLGRDGWIIREAGIVVCGDLIHSPHWPWDDDRLPLLRWLTAHHPDHVRLVPGEADWANLDAPDEATAELRRLAARGRVQGALAVGLLADGEMMLVPHFLTTVMPALRPMAGESVGGLPPLAAVLDQMIRVQRLIPPATNADEPTGQEAPTSGCLGIPQLVVTGGERSDWGPLDLDGVWRRLLHGHHVLPLTLDQVPDLPVSQLTIDLGSHREEGIRVGIAGPIPAERHHAWLPVLLDSLAGDVHDFLWNCTCGAPECVGIAQRVRIQHLGDSTLWSWPRPLSGASATKPPLTWVTVRFATADYRHCVLSALRGLRDRASDPALAGESNPKAEWMARWTLPEV